MPITLRKLHNLCCLTDRGTQKGLTVLRNKSATANKFCRSYKR